jgi:hypothetical protein
MVNVHRVIALRRRFRNGLRLMASYTWSKTLTDADAALPFFATLHGGGNAQNPYSLRGEKAISNQDVPHALVLSYVYDVPVGRGNALPIREVLSTDWLAAGKSAEFNAIRAGSPCRSAALQGPPGSAATTSATIWLRDNRSSASST